MSAVSLEQVITEIRAIRDDLETETITADTMPVADLGIDSLDLIQLARKLRKNYQVELMFEAWDWRTKNLGSILDHIANL